MSFRCLVVSFSRWSLVNYLILAVGHLPGKKLNQMKSLIQFMSFLPRAKRNSATQLLFVLELLTLVRLKLVFFFFFKDPFLIQHFKNNRENRVWFQNLVTRNASGVAQGMGRAGVEKEPSHLLKGKLNKDVISLLHYQQDKRIIETTPYNTYSHSAF